MRSSSTCRTRGTLRHQIVKAGGSCSRRHAVHVAVLRLRAPGACSAAACTTTSADSFGSLSEFFKKMTDPSPVTSPSTTAVSQLKAISERARARHFEIAVAAAASVCQMAETSKLHPPIPVSLSLGGATLTLTDRGSWNVGTCGAVIATGLES